MREMRPTLLPSLKEACASARVSSRNAVAVLHVPNSFGLREKTCPGALTLERTVSWWDAHTWSTASPRSMSSSPRRAVCALVR